LPTKSQKPPKSKDDRDVTTQLSDTVALLGELIAFPTVSELSNLDMIAYIAHQLEGVGATVDIFHDEIGHKANLFATIGPETDGGIVLSGHSDVVPVAEQDWASHPFEMIEHEGRLYGRGACDMKGFIAAATAMAPYFAETVRDRPIHFAFTYDEEVGCFGAQALVDSLKQKGIRPGVAIIGEPTSMRIIEGHKGCYEYTTHFCGMAGHGSAPDRGVNAVEYATRYVNRLLDLKDSLRARAPSGSRFDPPWTTINTGSLKGGVAHNVIASHATLEWEMRPVQASDAQFVKDDLRQYCETVLLPTMRSICPEAEITTEVIGEVEGLEPADLNEAKDIMMELTGANGADVVPFGTEAGIFQSYGMSAVVCGPGSIDQAHKPDEYVSLDQLQQCIDMLGRLGKKLAS
jgi:acetylornithine deacetylase